MKKWKWLGISVVIVGILTSLFLLGYKLATAQPEVEDEAMGLPQINIDLGGVTLGEIDENGKEIKYGGGNALSVTDGDAVANFDDVEIKGRGNSTWAQRKKPYQIKLAEKVDLLGLGKARKWYLLANYLDDTSLRNDIALMISNMLGLEPTLRGRFVELSINGEYYGLYYLTQPLEISKNILDLKDEKGILVELDNLYSLAETERYAVESGDVLTIKDVVNYDQRGEAIGLFLVGFNEMWRAIKERDFDRVRQTIDVESFVKYYLLSELTVNPDAYATSCYFYKDGVEDKIHAGPVWDFDLSLGKSGREERASRIYFELMEMPEFQKIVNRLYREKLAGKKAEILAYFEGRAEELREYIVKDNEKWDKGDFDTEVEYVVDWLGKRLDYFEYEYGGLKDLQKFSVEI